MKFLIDYALTFVGLPYLWGGDDPINGFDCSGFVQELLEATGIDPLGDQTAQGLYNYFCKHGQYNVRGPGALAFFGKGPMKVTHVGFCIDGKFMLEAGGGGSNTTDREKAAIQNAFIRMRPIERRKDLLCVVMPKYLN